MKFPSIPLLVAISLLGSVVAEAEEHLGPPVYLAAVHQVDGKSVVHWKYNIATPEYAEVRVTDSNGGEVARVKRPVRQADVAGRHGPFHLVALDSNGNAAAELLVPVGPATEVPKAPPVSRIGLTQMDGKAQFVHLASGIIFKPCGMNYVPLRGGDHAAFDAATTKTGEFYDELEAETVLRLLPGNGYNTVRAFVTGRSSVNPGITGEAGTQGVYTPYLDNVADFLQRASANGIWVILNFADANLPQNNYFRAKVGNRNGTENLFHEAGVVAFREMVASTLGYLKAKNPDLLKAILGISFHNEAYAGLNQWPFSAGGPVTTANGKTYDMSAPEDRKRCYEEGLAFYYEQLCDAVKSVDNHLLTCEGIFVGKAVGRDHRQGAAVFDPSSLAKGIDARVPPPLTVLAKAPLDFVDVHLYPQGPLANFEKEVEDLLGSSLFNEAVAAGLVSKKPVILGEFGAFKPEVKADKNDGLAGGRNRWSKTRDLACGKFGFVGYLGWSLETFEQVEIFQALAFGPEFLRDFSRDDSGSSSRSLQAPDPSAVAKSPMVLKEVSPTGPDKGFLIPQKLSP